MAPADSEKLQRLRRVRVLIADDDHARIEDLRHALVPSAYARFEITVLDSFETALERCAARGVDAVVLSSKAYGGRGAKLLTQLMRRGVPHPILSIVPTAPMVMPSEPAGQLDFIEEANCHAELLGRTLLHAVERRVLKARLIAAESRANQRSLYDTLTGLANRALLLERISRAMRDYQRGRSRGFALIFVDLDRFKNVNDSLGHLAGDKLLVEAAGRIRDLVRESDTVARTGADEYMVLLNDLDDAQDVLAVAEKLQLSLRRPFRVEGRALRMTASLGLCLYETRHASALDVYRDSDTAVHAAKAKGGDRSMLFGSELRARAVQRFDIENELPRAIEKRELEVNYQPIVELHTGKYIGAEALIRWRHPERAMISPLDFIEVAEATGLIVPLGQLVLTEACVRAQAWRSSGLAEPNFRVSVNVSPVQFKEGVVVDQVKQALKASGLPPTSLAVEITESLLIDDVARTTATLHELRNSGVAVYLDDFGTGYSSLSYLVNLPLTIVKIDRAFVNDVTRRENCEKLARGIVSLAHSLELETTAEGIEVPEQIECLRAMGCRYGQGYHYSKPVSGEQFEGLLRSGEAKGTLLAS